MPWNMVISHWKFPRLLQPLHDFFHNDEPQHRWHKPSSVSNNFTSTPHSFRFSDKKNLPEIPASSSSRLTWQSAFSIYCFIKIVAANFSSKAKVCGENTRNSKCSKYTVIDMTMIHDNPEMYFTWKFTIAAIFLFLKSFVQHWLN